MASPVLVLSTPGTNHCFILQNLYLLSINSIRSLLFYFLFVHFPSILPIRQSVYVCHGLNLKHLSQCHIHTPIQFISSFLSFYTKINKKKIPPKKKKKKKKKKS